MKHWLLALACGCLAVGPLQGQEKKEAKEDPQHEELRALKRELTDAVNKNDVDRLLTFLDEDVVVTWQDGTVSRKPDGVKAYFDKMMKGDKRKVESIRIEPEVDDLTHLYGDTGVAYGSSKDHFKLTDGREFVMPTRWSGTLVRKDGKWVIANFHASTDTFDNPVLHIAIRQTALWVGLGAGAVCLVLGFVMGRLIRKRPTQGGPVASPVQP